MPRLYLSESSPLRYFTFLYLYIMQGLPTGFALTAVSNYLTQQKLTPLQLGTFASIVGAPWAVKFIWGPVVDRFQGSPMGRRRPWVLGAQVLALAASLTMLFVGDPVAQWRLVAFAFAFHGLFASVQDVSVDALLITVVPPEERGRANAFTSVGRAIGAAVGAAGLAYVLSRGGLRSAVLCEAAVLLALTALTFCIREKPGDALFALRGSHSAPSFSDPQAQAAKAGDDDGSAEDSGPAPIDEARPDLPFGKLAKQLASAMLAPQSLLLFGAITVVYIGESVFRRAYEYNLINGLGWKAVQVSIFSGTIGTVLVMAAAVAGGVVADRVGPRKMLLGMFVLVGGFHVGLGLAGSAWEARAVATGGLATRQMLEVIFSIGAAPVLMNLCRRGVEGSQFAAYMAMVNVADIAGAQIFGRVQHLAPAPLIGVLCGGAMLAALAVAALAFKAFGASEEEGSDGSGPPSAPKASQGT